MPFVKNRFVKLNFWICLFHILVFLACKLNIYEVGIIGGIVDSRDCEINDGCIVVCVDDGYDEEEENEDLN